MPSPKTNARRTTSFLPSVDVRGEVDAPAGGAAGQIEIVGERVIPLDVAKLAGDAEVAPPHRRLVGRREVGERETRLDVLQLDTVGVDAAVTAGARTLERDHERVVRVADRRPADLDVAVPGQAGRAPVLERVREGVGIRERAPGTGPAPNCPSSPQAWRRRNVVCPSSDAGAEQLELEDRLQLAEIGRRRRLEAETALPHAGERAVVVAELILERRQLRQPQRVEPVGIDLGEVVPDVEHREAVDVEGRLRRM